MAFSGRVVAAFQMYTEVLVVDNALFIPKHVAHPPLISQGGSKCVMFGLTVQLLPILGFTVYFPANSYSRKIRAWSYIGIV